MAEPGAEAGFAPSDPTDARRPLDWRSKYTEPAAQRAIVSEAIYLAVVLFSLPVLIALLWLEVPKHFFGISDAKYPAVMKYAVAWVSGTLGGTLFSMKWLYHSVAKRLWHLDRRLWRLFTPHISGGLSFAVVALMSSKLIRVIDGGSLESNSMVVGLGFLIGYFSDSAIAKLSEVADTLFGESRSRAARAGSAKGDETKDASNP